MLLIYLHAYIGLFIIRTIKTFLTEIIIIMRAYRNSFTKNMFKKLYNFTGDNIDKSLANRVGFVWFEASLVCFLATRRLIRRGSTT